MTTIWTTLMIWPMAAGTCVGIAIGLLWTGDEVRVGRAIAFAHCATALALIGLLMKP
jgi:hypothetical protein